MPSVTSLVCVDQKPPFLTLIDQAENHKCYRRAGTGLSEGFPHYSERENVKFLTSRKIKIKTYLSTNTRKTP